MGRAAAKEGSEVSDSLRRASIAKAFVTDMRDRGIVTLDCDAFRYHLALLLRPEGHPSIKSPATDSVSEERPSEGAQCYYCGESATIKREATVYCASCDPHGGKPVAMPNPPGDDGGWNDATRANYARSFPEKVEVTHVTGPSEGVVAEVSTPPTPGQPAVARSSDAKAARCTCFDGSGGDGPRWHYSHCPVSPCAREVVARPNDASPILDKQDQNRRFGNRIQMITDLGGALAMVEEIRCDERRRVDKASPATTRTDGSREERFERAKRAWKEIAGEDVSHLVCPERVSCEQLRTRVAELEESLREDVDGVVRTNLAQRKRIQELEAERADVEAMAKEMTRIRALHSDYPNNAAEAVARCAEALLDSTGLDTHDNTQVALYRAIQAWRAESDQRIDSAKGGSDG